MKNTFKKVFCLVLVVCMLVSAAVVFTACKKEKPAPTPGGSTNPPPHTHVDDDYDYICDDCGASLEIAPPVVDNGSYTYNDAVATLASNWNPHTYQTSDDSYSMIP